jgi:uncharacterized Ntn-hydrolase superfamily protein
VGAVATQNITDPALGPAVLDALAGGAEAGEAIEAALAATRFGEYRQLLAVGAHGAPAAHSGARTLGCHATALGAHAAAGGNLLADEGVPQAMLSAYERSSGAFAHRLLGGLRAGLERGGEAGPIHSAGLLIVREVSWPIVDLRIDWSEEPLAALEALYERYAPQIEDYIVRALDPTRAPAFGVAGDR